MDREDEPVSSARKFAVYGNPIKHSKSPIIHTAFAAQFGHRIEYRAVRVELGDFERSARAFFERGGAGLNVTVPFKPEAAAFADRLSERARRAGAANTLHPAADGAILGDNTDGLGLVRDMVVNLGWAVQGARVLVLGAGGAARGVLEPLLLERPHSLYIANRTASKAGELAGIFGELGDVAGGGLEDLEGRAFDLVINATSAGLSGEVPPLPPAMLTERSCCYDMVYGAEPTAFMRWAAQHAAWAVADGLGMLVEQAAESYYRWHQARPETGPVIRQVREVLAAAA
ncbi:Shikimate 5-dehydrogenase I alpha [Pseudohaliea rubra DSM 19751]|uniref:Shikimate dehydrogenase (NADP(+)) n=1 Tax=Pseudohaliea rubra DSM 19751 TaxID=1265313 RepID=A0A095VTZ1_9GAMM|nr:Shikimate 5-dehydrogenase I alpha [Pseudohaliea rubra DSM 19751]